MSLFDFSGHTTKRNARTFVPGLLDAARQYAVYSSEVRKQTPVLKLESSQVTVCVPTEDRPAVPHEAHLVPLLNVAAVEFTLRGLSSAAVMDIISREISLALVSQDNKSNLYERLTNRMYLLMKEEAAPPKKEKAAPPKKGSR